MVLHITHKLTRNQIGIIIYSYKQTHTVRESFRNALKQPSHVAQLTHANTSEFDELRRSIFE